jgi:hypothetical protein
MAAVTGLSNKLILGVVEIHFYLLKSSHADPEHCDTDPDSTFHFDAAPYPDPTVRGLKGQLYPTGKSRWRRIPVPIEC